MNEKRLARVIANMGRMGLKQLIVSQSEAVYYLTGLWINPGERMLALKIEDSGNCTLYGGKLFALKGQGSGFTLKEYDDTDDPVALIAGDVKPGAIGVDKFWPSKFSVGLMRARRDLDMMVGSEAVDLAMMCKDEEELRIMRESSRINDEVTGALPATLKAGETEADVGRRYVDMAVKLGAAGYSFAPLICFGANCAEPHHNTDDTPLRKGDAVILDVGCEYKHMMSDMTRTVFFGGATDEQKKVYDIVKAANAAGRAAVRAGVRMCDIDRAARKVIEDAGYGPYFLHRTGHGIGLSVHEPPDCSSSCEIVTRPGMIFSIEPGIYLAGKFGVRIEDLVAVTEDGCEVLNKLDREMKIL